MRAVRMRQTLTREDSSMPAAITFVVPGIQEPPARTAARGGRQGGTAAPLPGGLRRGTVTASVRIGAERAAGGESRLQAVPGEDVVVLEIEGGPALTLHPEN